jgi:hypothetical protein
MVRAFGRYAATLSAAYILAWTAAYILVFVSRGDGFDFRYYLEYFALAWSFQAGELPAFIWILSLAGFLFLAPLAVVVVRRLLREGDAHQKVTRDATPTI